MPFHKEYADGTPRPLLRGWLHGISTSVAIPLLCNYWSILPLPAIPGLLAICFTLSMSSLVHLVPWKSTVVLEVLTRLDKSGILAICAGSFFGGPQLLENISCKPPLAMAIGTVAIPLSLSTLGVACGMGPIIFVGCAVAFFSTTGWYIQHPALPDDNHTFVIHSAVCIVLYGVGLSLYVSQIGGQTKYWGYHEWMHLLVTLSFIVNARGLLLMTEYNEKICMTSSIANDDLNMQSVEKPWFSWWALE